MSHPQHAHPQHAHPHAWPPPGPWPPHAQAPYPPPVFTPPSGLPPGGLPPGGLPPAPPSPGRRGKAVGWVIVLVGLLVLLVVGALALGGAERTPETGVISDPGTLSVTDLREGDCYNSRVVPPAPGATVPISTVEAVPCTSPHTGQVVTKLAYPSTDPFEGVTAKANSHCAVSFADELDATVLADPSYKAGYIAPADAVSWMRNPVVACIVATDEPLNRSLLG